MSKYLIALSAFLVFSFPCLSYENPYSSGGSDYQSANFSSNTAAMNNRSEYGPLNGNLSYEESSAAADSAENASSPPESPWKKLFQRKTTSRITGQPELDLANQRIKAGKARIRAIKAKERLDKHVSEAERKKQELISNMERAEEQAALLESQVKLQEANASDSI